MQKVSVFFDTNVLVYAHDELSPFHENSALLLDLALAKEITGIISEQNIMELYRILTNPTAMRGKPLSPSEARQLIEETYLSGNLKVVFPTRETTRKALELADQEKISSARIFDIKLYALALRHKPTYFATYNTEDFKNLGNLTLKTPAEMI